MSAAPSSAVRRALTPIDILRNCRGQAVSIELQNGETVNGVVMRTDRAMNVVLKQCTRTGATGEEFWRARETLLRGASVKNVRMGEAALKVTPAGGPQGGRRGGAGGQDRRKRGRDAAEGGTGDRAAARKQARK